ncbi:hypothetical protein Sjap_020133 [Stephania japonica]|uniref:Small auxin up regulated protein n=1 Tax=Stephania japonica TaxID=461633 RepID=A0AAP0F938_9MAGN
MGVHLPSMALKAKQIFKLYSLVTRNQMSSVPKGHFAVYVGETEKKWFVVPVSYLNHPSFQELLSSTEEEFGFSHPMGGLKIPCKESAFVDLTESVMGVHLPSMPLKAKQIFKLHSLVTRNQLSSIPKGHFAVYVGQTEKKRFVVPVSYLNHPSFQELLSSAEEEFGFSHPMGGLTIPCKESTFINLTSRLTNY